MTDQIGQLVRSTTCFNPLKDRNFCNYLKVPPKNELAREVTSKSIWRIYRQEGCYQEIYEMYKKILSVEKKIHKFRFAYTAH